MLKRLVLLLCCILAAGLVFEQSSRWIAEQRYPATGTFFAVNDHSLHAVVAGAGSPTVVFEAGMDPGGHLAWRALQAELATRTSTLAYDRAGVLWSERGEAEKSCEAMSSELEALLISAAVPPPYLLVGHSAAALLFRCFVHYSDAAVLGIVLVEPSHPQLLAELPEAALRDARPLPLWLVSWSNALGMVRTFNAFNYPGIARNDPLNQEVSVLSGRGLTAFYQEMVAAPQLASEAGILPDFGDIPLIVVSGVSTARFVGMYEDAALAKEVASVWERMQIESVALSTRGQRVTSGDTGHYPQLEDPMLVLRAIETLLGDTGERAADSLHGVP